MSKLKGDIDVIKDYMVRLLDKLDALTTRNKGKSPMVPELLQGTVSEEGSGGSSENLGTEEVPIF